MAELWHRLEVGMKVTPEPVVSRWRRVEVEVTSVLKVLSGGDVVRWTRVVLLIVGHRNICKFQRTVLIL
jgi:hypothetical protein